MARNGVCEETQEHHITIIENIDFTINPDPIHVCKDDVLTLTASSTVPTSGVTYQWSVNGTTAVTGNSFTLPTSIARQGNIEVTPSASGYCSKENNYSYIVSDIELIHDWPLSFCPDDALPLTMQLVQKESSGSMTMEWYADGVAQNINSTSAVFNPTQTTIYRFEVSDGVCTRSYNQEIEKVDVDIQLEQDTYLSCPGDEVQLNASTTATGNYSLSWTKLGESDLIPVAVNAYSSSIIVKPTERTLYTVQITNKGCSNTATSVVEMHPVPEILEVLELGIKEIQVMATGGTPEILFSIDDTNTYYDNAGYFHDDMLRIGKHTAYVMDSNGCLASLPFVINELPLEIEPFFTPNGDGNNDYWKIGNLEQFPYSAKVYIFDRFGKMLYKFYGNDTDGWDGNYMGDPMPSDDYWYLIYIGETSKKYVGHFTLIR